MKREAAASIAPAVFRTPLQECLYCKGSGLSNHPRQSEADVWDGGKWFKIQHQAKRCRVCERVYKLNYVATRGVRLNTLCDVSDNPIVLLNEHIGFTSNYLRQLTMRSFRAAVSSRAEAATIILTYPTTGFGHKAKSRGDENMAGLTDERSSRHLSRGMPV